VRNTCPTCKRPLASDGKGQLSPEARPFRPFCSERCRLADLGSWLDGAYRIGAPVDEEELDEGIPREGRDGDDDPTRN
jgi:endogenous inhibitor of DNA gyrase (YacG/DUF329 family)